RDAVQRQAHLRAVGAPVEAEEGEAEQIGLDLRLDDDLLVEIPPVRSWQYGPAAHSLPIPVEELQEGLRVNHRYLLRRQRGRALVPAGLVPADKFIEIRPAPGPGEHQGADRATTRVARRGALRRTARSDAETPEQRSRRRPRRSPGHRGRARPSER